MSDVDTRRCGAARWATRACYPVRAGRHPSSLSNCPLVAESAPEISSISSTSSSRLLWGPYGPQSGKSVRKRKKYLTAGNPGNEGKRTLLNFPAWPAGLLFLDPFCGVVAFWAREAATPDLALARATAGAATCDAEGVTDCGRSIRSVQLSRALDPVHLRHSATPPALAPPAAVSSL